VQEFTSPEREIVFDVYGSPFSSTRVSRGEEKMKIDGYYHGIYIGKLVPAKK
jgi:hypothetical protein